MDEKKALDIINGMGGICATVEEYREACKILNDKKKR